jgi:hypothetical protein
VSEAEPRDTPLLDELLNAAQGPAIRDVVEMRTQQIARYGHTREADADLPLDQLPREAAQRIQTAVERIRATEERRSLPGARVALVRAAAMCLAAVDRLDLAIKAPEARE